MLGEPIVIWGDGEVLRDYIYVDDLTSALVASAVVPLSSTAVFNLAGPAAYTLNQVIQEIERTLGVRIDVRYEPGRRFDVPLLKLDTRAAIRALNWKPVTDLAEGIERTAMWLRQWKD